MYHVEQLSLICGELSSFAVRKIDHLRVTRIEMLLDKHQLALTFVFFLDFIVCTAKLGSLQRVF